MKSLSFVLFGLLFFCSTVSAQQEFYLHPQGSGNGHSWKSASSDLVKILRRAQHGDILHLAAGTFTPTPTGDRTASFVIPDGVTLIGGYDAQQPTTSQPEFNRTILSGEIGAPGADDNSYTVVLLRGTSEQTTLSGLVIAHGNADAEGGKPEHQRGGGIFIDGRDVKANPTLDRITFLNNNANEGGALYNYGRSGEASPALVNCVFQNNSADLDGGAVYNDGAFNGKAAPTFIGCSFSKNLAAFGAAIFVGKGNAGAEFTVKNCAFRNNDALLWGGAIHSLSAADDCRLRLSQCKFSNNYPTNINKMNTTKQNIEGERVLIQNVSR